MSKNKKIDNLKVSEFIKEYISDVGYERFKNCSSFLGLTTNINGVDKKAVYSYSCGNRFCPICALVQSNKDCYKLNILMKYINLFHDKEFMLLTLTSANLMGDELTNEIDKFNLAFRKLVARKDFELLNKGYVRKLELTYNKKQNIYNIHFNVIFAVNKTYFKSRKYIKQEKWLQNWQECMEDDRITEVNVKRVNKDGSRSNATNEIVKYSAKDSDFLHSDEVFEEFYKALKGRQLITYNGLFKDAVKLYKSKYKEINLDKYKDIDDIEYLYFLRNKWDKSFL